MVSAMEYHVPGAWKEFGAGRVSLLEIWKRESHITVGWSSISERR